MNLTIPELSLVVLIGPSGSGKSTFAAKHFLPTEVVSSDYCRALVSDSETDLDATGDAFDLVREIAGFAAAAEAFARAGERRLEIAAIRDRFADRAERASLFSKAWL